MSIRVPLNAAIRVSAWVRTVVKDIGVQCLL
jgi:hypothetical protein